MSALSQTVLLAAIGGGDRTTVELAAGMGLSPGMVGRRLEALRGLGLAQRRAADRGRVVWERVELESTTRVNGVGS